MQKFTIFRSTQQIFEAKKIIFVRRTKKELSEKTRLCDIRTIKMILTINEFKKVEEFVNNERLAWFEVLNNRTGNIYTFRYHAIREETFIDEVILTIHNTIERKY